MNNKFNSIYLKLQGCHLLENYKLFYEILIYKINEKNRLHLCLDDSNFKSHKLRIKQFTYITSNYISKSSH